MTERSGQCMCGAVRVKALNPPGKVNACYCDMCRRWTGGRFLSLYVSLDELEIEGRTHIAELQTSDWAARASCAKCASPIWYRPKGGDHVGLSVGLIDDLTGLTLKYEYYVDQKRESFEPTDTTISLTTAETIALFAPSDEGEPQ